MLGLFRQFILSLFLYFIDNIHFLFYFHEKSMEFAQNTKYQHWKLQ